MPKILVLDDDQNIRDMLVIMLTREGYDVQAYGDPYKAMQGLRKESFDLIIRFEDARMDGLEFLRRAKKIAPETVVILITAYASGRRVAAMKEGAFDYIEISVSDDESSNGRWTPGANAAGPCSVRR